MQQNCLRKVKTTDGELHGVLHSLRVEYRRQEPGGRRGEPPDNEPLRMLEEAKK